MGFNKAATEFVPSWKKPSPKLAPAQPPKKQQYSAAYLQDVKRRIQHAPGDLQRAKLAERVSQVAPEILDDAARASTFVEYPPPCPQCIGTCVPLDLGSGAFPPSAWTEPACEMVSGIVDSVVREERAKHGAFLLQSPDVVFATVQHLALFGRGARVSRRVAALAELPGVVSRVKGFLCGSGFHYPAPQPDQDDQWQHVLERLRFDWIRDSRTPIFTELSRQWKRKATPFEQFAHFLFYRDDMPAHPSKNMLTHAQKPVIVACLAGDTAAVVLLCKLNFAVQPDSFWDGLPFFRDMLDRKRYTVLRHLCSYFYRRQFQHPTPIARVIATERHRMMRTPRLTPRTSPMQPPQMPPLPTSPQVHPADVLKAAPSLPQQADGKGRTGSAKTTPPSASPSQGKRWASVVAAAKA